MKAINSQPSSGLIHFTKWNRKGYSLFQVIGKVVKIGVLVVAYLISAEPAEAQKELSRTQSIDETDVTLEEVEVKGQRISTSLSEIARLVTVVTQKEIARSPYSTIQDYLDQELSIDIRQRGPLGVQTDISIKGSTFEQVLILINGIPFNDPQTGHFNGDIPVPLSAVDRIEIIDGGASRWLGPNAFAGAINIVTKTESAEKLSIKLQAGQNKFYNGDALTSYKNDAWNHLLAGSHIQTDGYVANTDLKSWKTYYSGKYQKNKFSISGQAGVGGKKFGAQAFYTPVYPDQYEEIASAFTSLGWKNEGKYNFSQDAYLKYHLDEFHLFRESGPGWYSGPNNHMTRVFGLINNVWWKNALGKMAVGLDYRNEGIWSNVLGHSVENGKDIPFKTDEKFSHEASRQNVSVYGEQTWTKSRLSIVAGILGHLQLNDSARLSFFPGIDFRYRTGDNSHVFSSVNRSLRTPSFTELYYSSPTNQGNPDLKPESAWSTQFGYRWLGSATGIRANIYGSHSKNNIDWSKSPDDIKWISRNINELYQAGFEFQGQLRPLKTQRWKSLKLKFGYRYGYVSKSSGEFDSRYVLDYLQHKIILSGYIPLTQKISINILSNYQDRAGSFSDWDENGDTYMREFDPFCLVDLKVAYALKQGSIYLDISNLLNTEYSDIAQVWQPGRWIRFGFNFSLSR